MEAVLYLKESEESRQEILLFTDIQGGMLHHVRDSFSAEAQEYLYSTVPKVR